MQVQWRIARLSIALSTIVLIVGCADQASSRTDGEGASNQMNTAKDYEALTGRWQLIKSVVNGEPVPEAEVRKTVLITDHDTFHFPEDAGVGTAPQGRFSIDPSTNPKGVDSTALAGPNNGKVTRGIYEILDAHNKRACWGQPGGPRPTDFTSTVGSGRTLQYWHLVSKNPR